MRARNRYDRLLDRSPAYPGARANRDRVQALIDEINRLSESQQEEAGVSVLNVNLAPGQDEVATMGKLRELVEEA